MSPKRRCCLWSSSVLTGFLATAVASPAPASLVELLRSLSASGYDILYSSELITPELTVPGNLPNGDLLARARAALAVHGLQLRTDGPKRYIVTRTAVGVPAKATAAAFPADTVVNEVTVFASRYVVGDETLNGPASFAHDDLEQFPGAQGDVMRAIRTVPGLANNLSARPYIRGAFLEDVLVRFDGIPMVDPFHFKNFQNLVSAFDPATVDRIDVYTGGFPVRYGTRSAGVFDIVPRSLDSGYENRAGANLLSCDLSSVGRADSLPIEWLATARRSTPNISLQPRGGDIGEPTYADALGRLRWHVNPDSAVILGWMLLDDRVTSSSDDFSSEQAAARDRDVYSWLTVQWQPSGAVHSQTSLSVASSERTVAGELTLPRAATGQLDERRDITTVDLRTDWTYLQSDAMLWEFGLESTYEHAELDFSRQETLDPALAASLNRTPDATVTAAQSPRSITAGAFVSARRRWRNFEAEVGIRTDRQDYHGFGSHGQFSPRLSLRYDPVPRWHLYGSWGQFRQAQRVGEWRSEENQLAPDPASHMMGSILGVSQDPTANLHWRLELYDNRWSALHPYFDNALNRLTFVPELGLDRVPVRPRGGESTGVEASVLRDFGSDWVLSMSYVLSKAVDDLGSQDVLRSWDQRHAFNGNLTWRHRHSSASLVIEWHSGWPTTPVTFVPANGMGPAFLQIGARNTARWGSYFSADVRVAHTFPFRSGDLLLWADATNVLNRDNECCVSYGQVDASGNLLRPATTGWYPRIVNVGLEWRMRRSH